MADDTRKSLRVDPNATSFTNQQWNTAEPSYKPPENANMMPGGTENTAGGKTKDVSFLDGIKSIKADDWTNLHRKPCVRDSLLTGIGAGVATGSMRAIWRAPMMSACNWAVGTFAGGAIVMYQYCNYQRLAEKEGMKRAMEIIDRKQIDRKQKEARMERARELRRQRKEEEDQAAFASLRGEGGAASGGGGSATGKPWYKVW